MKLHKGSFSVVALVLICAFFLSMVGCDVGSNNGTEGSIPSTSSDTNVNDNVNSDLVDKAYVILKEFDHKQEVKDFICAYELLMSLPSNQSSFVSQLNEINDIYEKYNVKFQYGEHYIDKYSVVTQDGINKYISQGAYYDAGDLLEAIVYPVLFEKYGSEAQSIKDITADKVISAIKSTGDYAFEEKEEQGNSYNEVWKYIGSTNSKYEVKYHANRLVESINVPIARHKKPMNDDEYSAFLKEDAINQKEIAGSRFVDMNNQFNMETTGYEVLSQIFTNEEINMISNYMCSLTVDDIWERSLLAVTEEPKYYMSAVVCFDYKGNDISVHYGLNGAYLRIIGGNVVNSLSHRWYTLWCGLCLPEGEGKDSTIELYNYCIENNVASNDIVQSWSYDLDANAKAFTAYDDTDIGDQNGNEETADVIDLFVREKKTVRGVIELNDATFPPFRLRLDSKIAVKDQNGQLIECEYLYFYGEEQGEKKYDFSEVIDKECFVSAYLEHFRGGGRIYLWDPIVMIDGMEVDIFEGN